jgi:hypothetical protein
MEKSLAELLKEHPEYIKNWPQKVFSGEIGISKDFNWLGLAEVAASIAGNSENNDRYIDILWGHIAVSVYDYLSQIAPQGRDSFENSAMNVRVKLILQYGNDDLSILSINAIKEWFFGRLDFSIRQVKDIIKNQEILSMEVLRSLRKIKNRLSIVERLYDAGYLYDDKDMTDWINVKKFLP